MTKRFDLLSDALGIARGELVAFVGGGGKTSAILELSRELTVAGWRVVASTTTRMGPRVAESMRTVAVLGDAPGEALAGALAGPAPVFVSAGRGTDGKFIGLDPWVLAKLRTDGGADALLVEADGARHLPLKAPGEDEPRVPRACDLLVPMAGLDAIGVEVEEGRVHRPQLVESLAGGGPVTPSTIATVITHRSGGLRRAPEGARVVPLLNKSDLASRETAFRTADLILGAGAGIDRVVVASLRDRDYVVVTA